MISGQTLASGQFHNPRDGVRVLLLLQRGWTLIEIHPIHRLADDIDEAKYVLLFFPERTLREAALEVKEWLMPG